MPTIDFDALRRERSGEPLTMKIGGKVYDLPPSLPASVALDINRLYSDEGPDADITPRVALRMCESLFGADLLATILRESVLPLDELPTLWLSVIQMYAGGSQSPNRAARRASRSPRSKSGHS